MKYKGKEYKLAPVERMTRFKTGSCDGCAFDAAFQCPGIDSTLKVDGHAACEPEGKPMIFKEEA